MKFISFLLLLKRVSCCVMAAALDPDQEPLLDSSSEQDKNGTSPEAVPSAPPLDEAEVSSSTGATPKTSSSEDHKKYVF